MLRRSCFIFQFGISTTLPSCDIEIILLAAPKIPVDMAAFIPELKHLDDKDKISFKSPSKLDE